jgi:ABC-type phosphate transport system ATPase subunit
MFTLENIMFDAKPGDLVCIIGPVGCGKVCSITYMTQCTVMSIYSEFTPTIVVGRNHVLRRSSSIAWFVLLCATRTLYVITYNRTCSSIVISILGIFSASIKANITFGREYDAKLFQRVIHVTALETVRS